MFLRRPACPAATALCALLFTAPAVCDTAVLAPSKDNTLYESATGGASNGAGGYVFAGRTRSGESRRALLAFDVAGRIPPRSTVTSATLVLTMSKTRSGALPVSVHRVLSDWGEGASDANGQEGAGAPAAVGDATWIHTFFDASLWSGAGGDFDSAPSASQAVDGVGSYAWGPTPDMTADVQSWLDDPGGDHGWLLLGDESRLLSAKRFDSRENPAAERRPRLVVEYTPPFRFDRFAVDALSLEFEAAEDDSFTLAASYALSDESDGIDPESEEVVLELGAYTATLPAGSFDCLGDLCRYDGEGPGLIGVVITPETIAVAAEGVNLSGTSNPVRVLVAVGNDEAATEVRAAGTLRRLPPDLRPRQSGLAPQGKRP